MTKTQLAAELANVKEELAAKTESTNSLTLRCTALQREITSLQYRNSQGRPTREQELAMCRTFVVTQLKGQEVDAMEAKNAMTKKWGISVDWHPMATALDEARTGGLATHSPRQAKDGFQVYRIKE